MSSVNETPATTGVMNRMGAGSLVSTSVMLGRLAQAGGIERPASPKPPTKDPICVVVCRGIKPPPDDAASERVRHRISPEGEEYQLDVARPATPSPSRRAGTRQPQHTMGPHVKTRADLTNPCGRSGVVELAAVA
jgi:hypothetical protein